MDTKRFLKENRLLQKWVFKVVQQHSFLEENRKKCWSNCNLSQVFKIISETIKLKMGIFECEENVESLEIKFVMTEFYYPKLALENHEYTKDKSNVSEIVDDNDEPHKTESEESGEICHNNMEFNKTHFPIDFNNQINEEHFQNQINDENEDEKEENKKTNGFDDLNFWKTTMIYSNKQIEGFIEQKDQNEK